MPQRHEVASATAASDQPAADPTEGSCRRRRGPSPSRARSGASRTRRGPSPPRPHRPAPPRRARAAGPGCRTSARRPRRRCEQHRQQEAGAHRADPPPADRQRGGGEHAQGEGAGAGRDRQAALVGLTPNSSLICGQQRLRGVEDAEGAEPGHHHRQVEPPVPRRPGPVQRASSGCGSVRRSLPHPSTAALPRHRYVTRQTAGRSVAFRAQWLPADAPQQPQRAKRQKVRGVGGVQRLGDDRVHDPIEPLLAQLGGARGQRAGDLARSRSGSRLACAAPCGPGRRG